MKTNIVLIIIISLILIYYKTLQQNHKNEILEKNNLLLKQWDDKISNYQFLLDETFLRRSTYRYFDLLDTSLQIIRSSLQKENFSAEDKKHLIQFIEFIIDPSKKPSKILKREQIYKLLNISSLDEIFTKNYFLNLERLTSIINPFGFSAMDPQIVNSDINIISSVCDFKVGDTLSLSIRLLKNRLLRSNYIKFIETENQKVFESDYGVLKYIVPETSADSFKWSKITFKVKDMVTGDTIESTKLYKCS